MDDFAVFTASSRQFAPLFAQSKHELPHMDNKLSGVSSGRCCASVSRIYGFVTEQQMSALITTAGSRSAWMGYLSAAS